MGQGRQGSKTSHAFAINSEFRQPKAKRSVIPNSPHAPLSFPTPDSRLPTP
ncbi:hypothetical protein H6G17_10065 [Chroococcidiopsis sp. FACHB-1243]|uniref:hypothetical protein n=1 Tax=Chroococcidiopsis sp. [FACHB-1243] TaxID=2692781 RepID=UPI00178289F6|nr:hypothetical protein [Chroococcidiopsis sp. [FACHB-1243]]MBD2305857.1 hypothetical protein [Chroococcidiopsis sp. [FACHB-1243]]